MSVQSNDDLDALNLAVYNLQPISFEVFNFDDVGGSMIFTHFKSMNEVGYVRARSQIYLGVLSCTNIPRYFSKY